MLALVRCPFSPHTITQLGTLDCDFSSVQLSFRLTWQQPACSGAPAQAISSIPRHILELFTSPYHPRSLPTPHCELSPVQPEHLLGDGSLPWQTLPSSQRLWVWPGRCAGPRKGAAGTGSDTVPTEPGLNSCPASPGGHPGLFCGCPGTCQDCLCLVLLQSGLRPLSQCGAALGVWPGARHGREACSVLWDAHTF